MKTLTNALLCTMLLVSCGTQVKEGDKYLKQKPPSLIPEVFAPKLVSKEEEYEFGSVFNKQGTEFFYGVDLNGKSEIRYSRLEEDDWSTTQTILVHDEYGFNDPFLSPDEQQLFFISRRPLDGTGAQKDYDIWYVERSSNGWSEPINAGRNINSDGNEYYISFTNTGAMYFSSNKHDFNFDIYKSNSINGTFQPPGPLDDSINTEYYEADVFIDPEESYIIFCANRPDGLGEGDLYISYKNDDGTWTESKNMGQPINSEHHELCPFVSKDGKYFFYTSNKDIYWVSADLINEIRTD